MMTLLKRRLRALSPRTYSLLRQAWNPAARLTCQIARKQGWEVSSGPFRGMRYLDHSHGSRLVPKLLGCYESELHAVVEEIIGSIPKLVIDVGCAEGYYAVGFARALSQAQVLAFDISEEARRLCWQLARLNGVADRVRIEGRCDAASLARWPLAGSVLIVDCEGDELELLQPDRLPGLAQATILVELHDCFVPGLSPQLLARFERTHAVRLFPLRPRDPDDYPSLEGLSRQAKLWAVDEDRRLRGQPITQQWAFLQPLPAAGKLAP